MNTMMTMKCGNVRIQTQVNAEKKMERINLS